MSFLRLLLVSFLVLIAAPGSLLAEQQIIDMLFVYPPSAGEPENEDFLIYEGKRHSLCSQVFIDELFAIEGVQKSIEVTSKDREKSYRANWAIKDDMLYLTGFISNSSEANSRIRAQIKDNKGFFEAYWYTGEVVLGQGRYIGMTNTRCFFQRESNLVFQIENGVVIGIEEVVN